MGMDIMDYIINNIYIYFEKMSIITFFVPLCTQSTCGTEQPKFIKI